MAGRPARRGELSVPSSDPSGAAQLKDLLALLDGAPPFLPVRHAGSDRWMLVQRDRVQWISLASAVLDGADGDLPLYDHKSRVVLLLDDGHTLAGELLYLAPEERARLADHLNRGERFVSLLTPEVLFLVRKAAILEIEEVDGGET